jgi:hypothetical protein
VWEVQAGQFDSIIYVVSGCFGVVAAIGLLRAALSESPVDALACWVYAALGLVPLWAGRFSH